MKAHQITYAVLPGDAISNHVFEIEARLRAWGYETAIYAQHTAPEIAGRVQPDVAFIPYLQEPDSLLIYHYSIYTPNIRLFREARGRRVLIYHNITPAHFFYGWDDNLALLCDTGRRRLKWLNDSYLDLALGDSDFNRQELVAAGVPLEKTGVLPIFLPQDHFADLDDDRVLWATLRQPGLINWLTVGRVAPNKAIEEIIRLFYVYNRYINPQSRLHIVGSRYISSYNNYLDTLITELGIAEKVMFAGQVSDSQLKTYYRACDLYLAASHHEGFCVPLVESMYFDLPILAHKATAIPETLGQAGVLYTHLGYQEAAEMAHLMVTDETLRQQIIRKQKERWHELGPLQAEAALQQALARLGLPNGK